MDTTVPYKRGQRRLQTSGRPSLLGNGLLERARSTSLALLGLTAAVGLGMVALALNQSWPLVAGGPIPGVADQRQAVGDATVAASAPFGGVSFRAAAGRGNAKAPDRPGRGGSGRASAPAGSPSPVPESVVVSHATPVGSADHVSRGETAPRPPPAGQHPVATPVSAPTPAPSPPASAPTQAPATSTSVPTQAPVPSSTPPPETSEESVDEEDDEDWGDDGHGRGHAYGWHHGH